MKAALEEIQSFDDAESATTLATGALDQKAKTDVGIQGERCCRALSILARAAMIGLVGLITLVMMEAWTTAAVRRRAGGKPWTLLTRPRSS